MKSPRMRGQAAPGRGQSALGRRLTAWRERTGVGVIERADCLLRVPRLFDQRFRVPIALLGGEKIATVNMNGPGQARNRVQHRMDDVSPEQHRLTLTQGLGPRSLDLPRVCGAAHAPPENVVLASGVDADR